MKILLLATIFITSSIAMEDTSNKGAKYSNVVRKCLQDGKERSLSSYKELHPSELFVRLAIEMILESLRLKEMKSISAEKALNAGQSVFAKIINFTTSKEDPGSKDNESEDDQLALYNESMDLIEKIGNAQTITVNYERYNNLVQEIETYLLSQIRKNLQQVEESCRRFWEKTNTKLNREVFLDSFVEKYAEGSKERKNTTPRPREVSEGTIRTYGGMLIDMVHAMECFVDNNSTDDFDNKLIRFLLGTKILSKVTRDKVTIENCAVHSLRGLLNIDPQEQRSERDKLSPFWEILLQNVDGVIVDKIVSFELDNSNQINLRSLLKELE